jgi:hypothetical protein
MNPSQTSLNIYIKTLKTVHDAHTQVTHDNDRPVAEMSYSPPNPMPKSSLYTTLTSVQPISLSSVSDPDKQNFAFVNIITNQPEGFNSRPKILGPLAKTQIQIDAPVRDDS